MFYKSNRQYFDWLIENRPEVDRANRPKCACVYRNDRVDDVINYLTSDLVASDRDNDDVFYDKRNKTELPPNSAHACAHSAARGPR